jgi:hypothetical protein
MNADRVDGDMDRIDRPAKLFDQIAPEKDRCYKQHKDEDYVYLL